MVPNGQQSQQISGTSAVNGQVRPDNAVPMFDSASGTDGLIPSREKELGSRSPSLFNVLQQICRSGTKDTATLPCPRQQMH